MNLHDLKVFATAARLGSVTKAARALNTVQSNVTARIRSLEHELEVPLFDRTHRGITLTPKGQQLLPYAQQLLVLADNARAAVTGASDVRGSIRIGSLHSIASARLPEVLKAFTSRHHDVDISVETGASGRLVASLLDGQLDAAFVSGMEDHPDLDSHASFVEELVIVSPPDYHSLRAYLQKTTMPKLLVFSIGCHYRRRLEQFVMNDGAETIQQMEFGTIEGIIGCVSAGLGITMLPRSVVERSARRNQVALHALPRGQRYVETHFVTHRNRARSVALEGLIEVVRSEQTSGRRQIA